MDDNLTERARKVKRIAAEHARRLRQTAIGTENLLYGILHTAPNVATTVLNTIRTGLSTEIKSKLEPDGGPHAAGGGAAVPEWDERCRRIFDHAAAEAKRLGHKHVGTEHIMLALVSEQYGKAKDLLQKAGVGYGKLRDELKSLLEADEGIPSVEVGIKQREDCRDLPLPTYMSKHASGMDLYAAVAADTLLQPGGIALVPTGVTIAVPVGFEAQVRPRSGLALKHGLMVANSPGTIDSDYRGEVGIILANMGREPFTIQRGMRIAQLVIQPVVQARLVVSDELDDTRRSDGGFGHTGA